MPTPTGAFLRFAREILLPLAVVAVLSVVIARRAGLTSTFRYTVERSRAGPGLLAAVVAVTLGVTYLGYLQGLPHWAGRGEPGQLGAAALGLGVGLLALALLAVPSYWRLTRTERTDLVSLPSDGVVFCTGTVEATEGTTKAPVSGTDCLLWEVRTECEREMGFAHRRRDVTGVAEIERDGVPFTVDDGTGRVRVDPSSATVACSVGAVDRDGDAERIERRLDAGAEVAVFGRVEDGAITGEPDTPFLVGDCRVSEPDGAIGAFHGTGNRAGPAGTAVARQVRRGIPVGAVAAVVGLLLLFG